MSFDPPASGSFPQAPPAPSLVGEVLDGRYRILKKLGEGGMGEVYSAEHVHIEKRFAVKLLKAEIVSNAEAVKRFQQEARSSSSIKHRNIIGVEDFGRLPDGRIYMCMELLDGAPLNDMIQQPMSADRLLNILIQAGHGLAAAHAKGIVHRDMKPENIYVTNEGNPPQDVPKLLDFGIAKVAGNDGQNNLTRTGTIFGTPFYMAPEQALGNPVDARTDIYAMGVIMYECFAGSLPFQGESFMGILTQHITTPPEPVAQRAANAGRALPMGVAEIITKCMEKDPNARYRTMDELVNALIQIYRGVAGPGMSTYMEAFPVGSSAHLAQPTPPPMTGAHMATPPHPLSATAPAGAYGSGGSQPVIPAQYSGPSAALSSPAGHYDPSGSSVVTAPKKSKTGLIVAICVVLAAGGGIAAMVVLGSKKDDKTAQNGSGSADVGSQVGGENPGSNTPDVGSAGSQVATGDHGSAQNVGSDAVNNGSGGGSAVGTNDNGSGSGQDVGSGGDVTAPASIAVTVFTIPYLDEFEIWEDGKKVQNGSEDLSIVPGESRTIVVKAKGFKDSKPLVVDGKKTRLKVSLSKLAGTTTTPVVKPSTGPDCTKTIVDNKNKRCVAQYCAAHPDDFRCDAE
ncbi:MAG: protein kinase [Kofleriaceae bacterium]|nr:protein kinase [Kofleriaceae bacterium]